MHEAPLELWFWIVTDEVTKRRRQTRYRMTQADASERFGADAVRIDGSLEVRARKGGHTSDFLRRALLLKNAGVPAALSVARRSPVR